MADQPLVGIIMGSKSDMPVMEACTAQLEELGVPYELVIASAHRNPDKVHEWAGSAAERGLKVISSPEEVKPGERVLIRSHGISSECEQALLEHGAVITDATCPNVARIHRLAAAA